MGHKAIWLVLCSVAAAALISPAPSPLIKTDTPEFKAPRMRAVATAPTALLDPHIRQPETSAPLGLPAEVEDAPNVTVTEQSFPRLNANYKPAGSVKWRIVNGTGNCCENYITVTPQGMLLDFGGDYIYFSTDDGKSWRRVVPSDPLPNFGEGTIAIAHNGDIIGVAWNPYYGDRVQPFKYSVEDEGWYYTHTKLHQPFYDRESVAVIPGPFEFAGERYPYLSVLRGGWPAKTPWFYSFDGLNYFVPNARFLDVITEQMDDPLDIKADPMLDWIQPAEQSAITPLGKGKAIARRADFVVGAVDSQFARLNPNNLRWSRFEFASGPLPEPGVLRVDSKARLHYVARLEKGFKYFLSTDGGKNWVDTKVELPKPYESRDMETIVNGELQLGVVTIHARDEKSETNQDFVYKFSLKKDVPKLKEIYLVGDGKGNYDSGVTAAGDRFDFPTIVIMPDGRLALSFASSTAGRPQLAIQL